MPSVTDLLICDTGLLLLEWYICSISTAAKAENTKAPYRLGPLMTNFPESWYSQTKRMLLVILSWNLCLFHWPPDAYQHVPSRWQRPERIFSLIIKPSSQDTEHDEKKTSSSFYTGDPQQSLSKQMPVWWENLSVCETSSHNKLVGPLLVFYMTNDTKDRVKRKQWPYLGGIGSIECKNTHQIFTRVTIPKELVHINMVSANLNLEKQRGS